MEVLGAEEVLQARAEFRLVVPGPITAVEKGREEEKKNRLFHKIIFIDEKVTKVSRLPNSILILSKETPQQTASI